MIEAILQIINVKLQAFHVYVLQDITLLSTHTYMRLHTIQYITTIPANADTKPGSFLSYTQ